MIGSNVWNSSNMYKFDWWPWVKIVWNGIFRLSVVVSSIHYFTAESPARFQVGCFFPGLFTTVYVMLECNNFSGLWVQLYGLKLQRSQAVFVQNWWIQAFTAVGVIKKSAWSVLHRFSFNSYTARWTISNSGESTTQQYAFAIYPACVLIFSAVQQNRDLLLNNLTHFYATFPIWVCTYRQLSLCFL